MHVVKRAAGHAAAMIRGMLFIGFSVQILLGLAWMCRNFFHVQDFGEPEGALYGLLAGLFGGMPQIVYVLQIAAAFSVGYGFLQYLWPVERALAVWRGLALLTFPFAMQCHLALQPYSLMGSFFLLLLLFLLRLWNRRAMKDLALAFACGASVLALSGAADPGAWTGPGRSFQGAMASRFAWPTVWNDLARYPGELREMTEDVAWEASICPGNMELFFAAVEDRVGTEEAKSYYLRIAEEAWDCHASMVIRQIGWDVIGYAVSPVIFRLQMEGEAYASCSGRNYEIMREEAPVVTRNYVDYGCWWFGCALLLALASRVLAAVGREVSGSPERRKAGSGKVFRKLAGPVGICLLVSGILVLLYTMRGAGWMDYRATIAVNELWLCCALLALGGRRRERIG